MTPQQTGESSEPRLAGSLRATIVVVDDEEDVAEVLAAILEREGYRVLRATHGREALDFVEHDNVDLVVMDYAMPGMHGTELLAALSNMRKMADVPVIIVSAFSEASELEADLPSRTFLAKPFKARELIEAVRSMLDPT